MATGLLSPQRVAVARAKRGTAACVRPTAARVPKVARVSWPTKGQSPLQRSCAVSPARANNAPSGAASEPLGRVPCRRCRKLQSQFRPRSLITGMLTGLYPSRGNCQFPLKTSEMGSQNQNQVYTYTNTLYCGTSKRQIRLY